MRQSMEGAAMRPETMGWHDAAGIADFPGDIDGTDETTAAPGMVFTPQTAADTNQDQRTDHDDGSRQTAAQYDSSAPESTVNQPHTSGVAVAAFPIPNPMRHCWLRLTRITCWRRTRMCRFSLTTTCPVSPPLDHLLRSVSHRQAVLMSMLLRYPASAPCRTPRYQCFPTVMSTRALAHRSGMKPR